MDEAALASPVWAALTTSLRRFSVGDGRALRFLPDIGPFAATVDESDESLAALGRLLAAHGPLAIARTGPARCPPGARIASVQEAVQMHFSAPARAGGGGGEGHALLRLGDAESAEMCALAELTRPGPFASHTHRLGTYLGIRIDGRLAAMAGERMRQPGFTEISAVCTHPDFQGLGLARRLCLALAAGIEARGERAYLHVYTSNAGAMRLYERIGFVARRTMMATVFEPC